MSLGVGAWRGWWSRAMHTREGGIHGNPGAATTHLGTITLKDSVEYLPTHHKAQPTQGRVGRAKSEACERMCWRNELANDSEQHVACKGHERPLRESWATPSFVHPAVAAHCVWASQSVPANCQGCKQASCIRKQLESIALRLTLPKLHLATLKKWMKNDYKWQWYDTWYTCNLVGRMSHCNVSLFFCHSLISTMRNLNKALMDWNNSCKCLLTHGLRNHCL